MVITVLDGIGGRSTGGNTLVLLLLFRLDGEPVAPSNPERRPSDQ